MYWFILADWRSICSAADDRSESISIGFQAESLPQVHYCLSHFATGLSHRSVSLAFHISNSSAFHLLPLTFLIYVGSLSYLKTWNGECWKFCIINLGNIGAVMWRMFSTLEDIIITVEGIQYCWGCSLLWRVFSDVKYVKFNGLLALLKMLLKHNPLQVRHDLITSPTLLSVSLVFFLL